MRADWLKIDWFGPLTLPYLERGIGRPWVRLTGGELIAEACGPGSHDLIAGLRDEFEQDHQPPEFVCPVCGAESWHPMDRRYGYCGRCHDYAADPDQETTR